LRFINYLNEAYATTGRSFYGAGFPIFINPSSKEIKEASGSDGYLRYCVDLNNKNIFVWDYQMTHVDASGYMEHDKLVSGDSYPDKKGYIWGVADVVRGKLVDSPENGYYKNYIKFHGIDKIAKDWTGKYFNPSLLDTMKAQAR
jgi:hypothetical protein